MSIVPLARVTAYGLLAHKAEALDVLQAAGCLHLVPLSHRAAEVEAEGPSPAARNALAFLLACPQRRRQVHDAEPFDADQVEHEALELQQAIRRHEDERDRLLDRLERIAPWGQFELPPPEALGGLRFWFFVVPHWRMPEVPDDLAAEVVRRDNRFSYLVVVAAERPDRLPVPPVDLGTASLAGLERRLEAVEVELDELQARRAALTRWIDLFALSLARLEDRAARGHAARLTLDSEPLFAIQGWAPVPGLAELEKQAVQAGLALEIEQPGPDDAPPTLLNNPAPVSAGQDLVTFYSTPGYRDWDPSGAVYVSFCAFFAMILSDAGYGLAWLGLVWWFRRRFEGSPAGPRLRRLFYAMGVSAVVWGVLVGSWFGLSSKGHLLGGLAVVDLDDYDLMMTLSVLIGVGHVVAANLGQMRSLLPDQRALAPLGWTILILAGLALWLGDQAGYGWPVVVAPWLMGTGGVLVLVFTSPSPVAWRRLVGGLLALTRITSAFGDVLSYLRLFALGLASASLALVFNDLAGQVAALPGVGLFLAILIVVFGHGLNFALAVVGGFVHGLRLNYIEFFNWGLAGEGFPFRPFAKKEGQTWTRS